MIGLWTTLAFASIVGAGRDLPAGGPGTPIGPTSRVWITGASNIRRFTCRARQVDGTLSLRGTATRGPHLSGQNVAGEPSLSIAVDRLECGIGAMTRHLRETLRSNAHPVITFRLTAYDLDVTGPLPVARITGEVTVAGVTRAAIVDAGVVADSLGQLRVRGTHVVRLSDFGLEPPRRFGGLLRVRDRVTVHFDVEPGPHHTLGCTDDGVGM